MVLSDPTDDLHTLFDSGALQDAAELGAALAAPAMTGRYDELRGGAAALRTAALAPLWRDFFNQVGNAGIADLDRRADALGRRIHENALAYQPHTADTAAPPWSLDLLPMIVSPADWATIERGVLQRMALLNAILADVYGEQTLLKRGLLPPALVTGHPGYLRPMCGAAIAGDTWLHVAAFDLARGPDGQWRLMAQHTQGPTGLGYILENRLIVSRLFPRAFRGLRVQRLAAGYRALLQSLQTLSPARKNSRIVLLTPGPLAPTYFEHAYLARYLGLTLVEGGDLTTRHNHVYLKTLRGLEPVHGILRRVDDDWLDPLELRPDSLLGIPGLLRAVRAGNVLVANAPGSGFLESPGILAFLPKLAQSVLGEPLSLAAVPSWWCGEAAACDEALPQLARSIVKPAFPDSVQAGGAFAPAIMAGLGAAQLAQWRARILANPAHYVIQADMPLSQAPTWAGRAVAAGGARIVPRPVLMRVFAVLDGAGSWRVLPGGLSRVGTRDELFNAPMPRGGSSVDTWIVTDGAVDPTTLLQTHLGPDDLVERPRTISSRAAENLFWLGRYAERAANLVRLARTALEQLRGENAIDNPAHLELLDALCHDHGLVTQETAPVLDAPHAFQLRLASGLSPLADRATGIASCVFGMRTAAAAIRERLSRDQWQLIDEATQAFEGAAPADDEPAEQLGNRALQVLDRLNLLLSAITGAQTDNMTRDDGWRLLSIGRQIDRLDFLCGVLDFAFERGVVHRQEGFELVLELFDSAITFRSRFQRCFDVAPLLSLLVLDSDNPRSLAWVVQTMRGRLAKIQRPESAVAPELEEPIPEVANWSLHALCETDTDGRHTALLDQLHGLRDVARTLSDRIGERYFSHVREAGRSLWG